MTVVIFAAAAVALAASLGALYVAWGGRHGSFLGPPSDGPPAYVADLWTGIDGVRELGERHVGEIERLQAGYKELVLAVDEGIQDVKRRENRIRAVVRRAQEELEAAGIEVPAVTAESIELRELDGDGGPPAGVPEVPDRVELPSEIPGIPGRFSPAAWASLGGRA